MYHKPLRNVHFFVPKSRAVRYIAALPLPRLDKQASLCRCGESVMLGTTGGLRAKLDAPQIAKKVWGNKARTHKPLRLSQRQNRVSLKPQNTR